MMTKKLTLILMALSFCGLAQCGGGSSNSALVAFKVLTPTPVLVNAPITVAYPGVTPTYVTYNSKWFKVNFDMINGSSNKLYWVTTTLDLSGFGNGITKKTTVTYNPGTFCPSPPSGSSGRTYIAVLAAGTEYTHVTSSCDPTTAKGSSDGLSPEDYYAGGLDTSVTSWSAVVTNLGWFVDANDIPIERLVSVSGFGTQ
jgi:hypothetical protein